LPTAQPGTFNFKPGRGWIILPDTKLVHRSSHPSNLVVSSLLFETPSVEQLSGTIGSVAAPAFLLGALAAFISVLISRMNRIIDRSQFLHGIGDADGAKSYLKADIPRLKSRAALLNRAVFYATLCDHDGNIDHPGVHPGHATHCARIWSCHPVHRSDRLLLRFARRPGPGDANSAARI
jgi:hypothetical protein